MAKTSLPPRKRAKKKSIWPYVIVGFLIFFISIALGIFYASKSLLDKSSEPEEVELLTAKDKATIMIMGVDERADDVGRSDTLMVATIDPKRNEVALLSIPRDTRVNIPRYGYDKINAAYALGGAKLTESTVEQFLGINIDHYIIINTKAFVKIIDALGGVDIVIDQRMYYEDPWDDDGGLVIDLRPGEQHMDGKTAVTYVRYRDEEGDIGRVHRQQKFMKACFDALVSPRVIPRLPAVISEVMDSVKTNLSLRQLLEFAGTLKEAHNNGLKTEMVPGRPMYIDDISYWIADLGALRRSTAKSLGVTLSKEESAKLDRAAREYEADIPANATEDPDYEPEPSPEQNKASEPAAREDKSEDKPKKSKDKKDSSDGGKKPASNGSQQNNKPAEPTKPVVTDPPRVTPPVLTPSGSGADEPSRSSTGKER